jgi:hypothetical protein
VFLEVERKGGVESRVVGQTAKVRMSNPIRGRNRGGLKMKFRFGWHVEMLR